MANSPKKFFCGLTFITALAGCVIFLSSFLLFQVQPILARKLLPVFGGAPATWNTCLVFFQAVLFLGYIYSHLSFKYLSAARALFLHIIVALSALLALYYFTPTKPISTTELAPEIAILYYLALAGGLPYFLLSTTTPLLQGVLANAGKGDEVYRLYGLSNFGSLLALLSYPVVIEPHVDLSAQLFYWSTGFACFVILVSFFLFASSSWQTVTSIADSAPEKLSTGSRLHWFFLAACGTLILTATTNHLCQNVASIPFLWVVPLVLYLLSFIIAFSYPRMYSRRIFSALYFLASALIVLCASVYKVPQFGALLVLFSAFTFLGCTICHAELERLKPAPKSLTHYYVITSLGGIFGTTVVAFLAPLVLTSYSELWLAVAFCPILLIPLSQLKVFKESKLQWTFATSVIALATCFFIDRSGNDIARARDFFGVLRVAQRNENVVDFHFYRLFHGPVVHGLQFQKDEKQMIPTAYYGENSGVGFLLKTYRADRPRRVGVIGLGVGTLAAYSKAQDYFRYYEINPTVVKFANAYFSYLRRATAQSDVIVGDARTILEQENSQEFDILVVDAFSGDSIPIHLITDEALEIYQHHLTKGGGALVFHITNNYMDFVPVLIALAKKHQLSAIYVRDPGVVTLGQRESHYMILTRDHSLLGNEALQKKGFLLDTSNPTFPVWTDDFNNTFSVIRW